MPFDTDLINGFRETARRFAHSEIASMVGAETRDGNLAGLPDLLGSAAGLGLMAGSRAGHGHEGFGVWGPALAETRDAASVAILEEIAAECAGVASCLHHAGLGAAELASADGPAARPAAVALFGRDWRAGWDAFERPPAGAPVLADSHLEGSASFVAMPQGADRIVVYAAGRAGWERVVVAHDAPGLRRESVGPRAGLAAIGLEHLDFDGIAVDAPTRLGAKGPGDYVRRLLLGLAAIAVGNARGALRLADRYAGERRQGGRPIGHHPSVRLLLGESRSRVAASAAIVAAATAETGPAALWHAASAKLRAGSSGLRAVSDCLQVLAGYGYMEDYRLEKRLRDAMTLVSSAIDPATLRLMCADDPDRR